jgi:hypothetical protein
MITIFYAKYQFLNPNFPSLLAQFESLAGPRLSVIDISTLGEEQIRRAIERSDVVMIDQSVANAATWVTGKQTPTYYVLNLRPKSFYEEILGFLLEAQCPRAFLANSDLHDFRDADLYVKLAGRIQALFWMFERQPVGSEMVPPRYREPFVENHSALLEAWRRTVSAFPIRVEVWFSSAPAERATTQARSLWQVCVPGANYVTRKMAAKNFDADHLRRAPTREVQVMTRLAHYLLAPIGPQRLVSRAMIAWQQQTQRILMHRSAVVFVCGSGLRYAVRKFLEVPVTRTAMICYPCVGFEDLGFRDGIHTVATLPEDASKTARQILRNPKLRDSLINSAWTLATTQHSVERRAEQLLTCLDRLRVGQLRHAHFEKGEFVIC